MTMFEIQLLAERTSLAEGMHLHPGTAFASLSTTEPLSNLAPFGIATIETST